LKVKERKAGHELAIALVAFVFLGLEWLLERRRYAGRAA